VKAIFFNREESLRLEEGEAEGDGKRNHEKHQKKSEDLRSGSARDPVF